MNIIKRFNLYFLLIVFSLKGYAQQPNDCIDAIVTCGNSDVSLDVNGSGLREFANSCSSNENNSVWLKVTVVTSGTLGFTLTPESTAISEDYDFFVFGPNVSCSNVGSTIRCSTTNPQAASQGNNLTGMNASSSDTSEGPGALGDSFVKWLDVNAGESYFIVIDRPIGNSPFNLEWTGTARFADPPNDQSSRSGTPTDIESCDITAPFNDGFTTFNLTDNTSLITGTQTGVTISYHASESDANININPLTSPYTNLNNPQKIFARITNNTTGCFELTDFNLSVNLGPNIKTPADFILCDNTNDGDDRNGRLNFNLSSKNNEILNGLSSADYNVTYHRTNAEAENRRAPLPNLYYNNSPFNEQVFVRVENTIYTDCRSITPLNLIVNPNPLAFNHTIIQCDEDGVVDGSTLFNLNEANSDLTENNSNLSTKFYLDAARTIEVNGDSFNNTSNPQTIYVEVSDTRTGCLSHSELTIEVSLTDSINAALFECDDDGIEDGIHIFNLREADPIVTNGLPIGLIISYYQTYQDALLEQNGLSDSFTNTTPYSQTIFARVENNNNCYGISEVALTVHELPNITTENLTYYCLNFFPSKITLNAAVLNDSPSNYTYNWTSGEDTYEIEINETGVYIVTVTNSNNCSKSRTINVEPSNLASFENIEVKDATENNIITVFVSGEGDYQYRLLDENNVVYTNYQNSNVFENVFPGIYSVSVKDIKNDCGTVNNKVSVIGFPKFLTPNNDGKNDTWQVYGVSSMFQPNTKIQIFDRFGKLIKELNPLGEGWNGLLNGEKLPTDDYWFLVVLQDGRVFKSHFTLKN
ncbi:T9SS type B sorting domain-containing protein [Seonamhaeicola maritimus]|uniref:T9SS type B sorting domain-containing protein n=1 Tax=Seonamhaeicola maritimus TaxID=2591822 RepID=UPI001F4FDCD2|nr:T9SS type B sorting domain-containing protein [Seonamhaeicola maritimus]